MLENFQVYLRIFCEKKGAVSLFKEIMDRNVTVRKKAYLLFGKI